MREITFGHAVITWNFFPDFYCFKIASFWPLKVRFEGKKQKDMTDDGIYTIRSKVTPVSKRADGNALVHVSAKEGDIIQQRKLVCNKKH